jgi:hypothetical protein
MRRRWLVLRQPRREKYRQLLAKYAQVGNVVALVLIVAALLLWCMSLAISRVVSRGRGRIFLCLGVVALTLINLSAFFPPRGGPPARVMAEAFAPWLVAIRSAALLLVAGLV